MDKVLGQDAPDRYYQGKPLTPRRWKDPQGYLVLSNVIVKIDTDFGISGIGENPMNWAYLIDLVSWNAARGETRHTTSDIDLARAPRSFRQGLGVPVHTLLGGCRREKVLASIEVPRETPQKMAEHSQEYYQ